MTQDDPSLLPGVRAATLPARGGPVELLVGEIPNFCESCVVPRAPTSIWDRYRDFFLAPNTIITILCGALLVAGAVAEFGLQAPRAANVLWALSALVGGAPIFLLAGRGIVKGDLTAGVMVSVAMIGALLIGEYSAAALVAFMMMFGEILENFTMARADNALRELARLLPEQASLLRNGQEVVVPLAAVRPGDVVLVRNGGRIPVDGKVLAGQAAVDQSTITGESIPVDKGPGDQVFAGTLNRAGTLQVEAQKVGQETTLGTVVKLVAEAQRTQAPVQRLANRYAQFLVPITFTIAVLTLIVTGQPIRAVTVLVVVCPCALVLATPTALVAAIANAARHQVVVKTGAALEALGRVGVVAFDKTGTLTLGWPAVAQVEALDGLGRNDILRYAAGAERYSEHPLGRAIVQAATGEQLAVPAAEDVTVLTGLGVLARSEERLVLVGQPALLEAHGVTMAPEQRARLAGLEQAGYTVVAVALDGKVAGLIALADAPRPAARGVAEALRLMGIKTVLISGDNAAAVGNLARTVGVEEYHAGVLPAEKLQIVRELAARDAEPAAAGPGQDGRGAGQPVGPAALAKQRVRPRARALELLEKPARTRVAFVGDGVNDAPALAAANVGIAMGGVGTDVAVETAQVALMSDDISRVPHLLALSRETLRTIRICVIFSMSMNVLALTLSMAGVIGPAAGALMHELSAIPVLAYSARLVAYRSG